jgi:hypothetical protein
MHTILQLINFLKKIILNNDYIDLTKDDKKSLNAYDTTVN